MEMPTPRGAPPHGRSWLADAAPGIAAAAAACVGLVLLASTQRQPATADTARLFLLSLAHAPLGVALIAVGWYLWRRRRRALTTAVVLLLAAGVLEGPMSETTTAALLAAALLVASRHSFPVESKPFGAPCSAWVVPLLTAILLSGLLAAVWLRAAVRPDLGSYLGQAAVADTASPWEPLHLVTVVFWLLSACSAAHWAFRSTPPQPTLGGRKAAAELVCAHGSDTLAAFKLRTDLDYYFSSCGAAFAGYRMCAGVLLVAGDPVGRASAIPGLLREITGLTDRHDLCFGAVGASPAFAGLCEAEGLHAMYIGDEAIVDPRTFSLEGRAMRKVRQSTHRLERAGYTVECSSADELDPATLGELDRISTAWRGRARERGFAMALDTLDSELAKDVAVFVTRDGAGRPRAFLEFVPTYGRAALCSRRCAAIRRRRTARRSSSSRGRWRRSESVARWRSRSTSRPSVGCCVPLSAASTGCSASSSARPIGSSRSRASIASTRSSSRSRYPRYLVYDRALALPRIALATLSAEGRSQFRWSPVRPTRSGPLTARLRSSGQVTFRWRRPSSPAMALARTRALPPHVPSGQQRRVRC